MPDKLETEKVVEVPKEKKKPGRKKKVIPTIQFEKKEVILLFD
jgi:hypothetical protein